MITSYERGKSEGLVLGKQEGKIEIARDTALKQLDIRFGPLDSAIKQRVTEMNFDQLQELLFRIVKVSNVDELQLGG